MSAQRPLRVLLVTETYPPELNGVAMTLSHLVRGMRERGHWVGLARPRQAQDQAGLAADTWALPGLPIPNYPGLRLGLPAWGTMRRLIREQRPDVVHIATEGPLGWSALLAARRLGVPVSSGYHTHFDQYSGHYGLKWLMPGVTVWLDALHRRCQATLAPTPELAAALAARGIPNAQVLGRGVDTRLFHPGRRDPGLRSRWGARDDAPVCLFVGRLAPEKNLVTVARAFTNLVQCHPGARMVWVGDGPCLARLRRIHPDHHFAGPRVGDDLAAHYASADLFLFASLSETWGNVIGEAMASGLAVLAYRRAAGEKLIRDGENGRTVTPGDAEAFLAAALELAGSADRRRMGEAARKSLQDEGWDAVVQRFEHWLRSLSGQ
jgi:glycosyltransferase involved in cell wall biosynthesis